MKDWRSLIGVSARNPLGIVALFISLIYGMSALLLGTSASSLTKSNQTILILFIVIFPVLILLVFFRLVTNHHKKLYGPGDFRTDEAFNSAISPPQLLGERLKADVEADEKINVSDADGKAVLPILEVQSVPSENPTNTEKSKLPTPISGVEKSAALRERMQKAYLAENLIFQELQTEFGGLVQRGVRLMSMGRRFFLDGVIRTSNEVIAVEVKVARSESSVLQRLGAVSSMMMDYRRALGESEGVRVRGVIVFVIEAPEVSSALRENLQAAGFPGRLDFRVFSFSELLKKYGLE